MQIRIEDIIVKEGRRPIDTGHVKELAASIKCEGLFCPLTVNSDNTLIAGGHRLEAVKLLGWSNVECNVVDLDELHAELAEIDENLVRRNLDPLDEADQLLRRKQIYEKLHPETKAAIGKELAAKRWDATEAVSAASTKSFAEDTADKTGLTDRAIRSKIYIAKNLNPEVREIVRGTGISERNATKLARIKDETEQKEAAEMLASKEIKTVNEYHAAKEDQSSTVVSFPFPIKTFSTFEESIADLKDPNKDCSCTPEILLMEYEIFAKDFIRNIEWYATERYTEVYPELSEEQRQRMTGASNAMRRAIGRIISLTERKHGHELQKA